MWLFEVKIGIETYKFIFVHYDVWVVALQSINIPFAFYKISIPTENRKECSYLKLWFIIYFTVILFALVVCNFMSLFTSSMTHNFCHVVLIFRTMFLHGLLFAFFLRNSLWVMAINGLNSDKSPFRGMALKDYSFKCSTYCWFHQRSWFCIY